MVAGTLCGLFLGLPLRAAERISFTYGPLQESLQVSSLEAFAKTGQVNSDLRFYFKITAADAEKQKLFQEALSNRPTIDPILISRFFYSEVGEDILQQVGQLIQIPPRLNGKYALRSALILAALDQDGLTLLNVLKKYPTDLQIDVKSTLELSQYLERVVQKTTEFTTILAQLSQQAAATGSAIDVSHRPDLSQPGPWGVQQQRWTLTDAQRQRQFYVDVYQPQRWRPGKAPVVVLSHGLASKPEDFSERAEHLASYGFVVALPQHPGSDYQQAVNLIQGFSGEVFLRNEFIDRPQDIRYVIDELERRNASQFEGRLNLETVGVAGHSFGGYSALAVAGATIDFEHLQRACEQKFGYLNLSLLLQCRALQLPRQAYNFRDPRVKAVLVANAVNNAIFGPKGLAQIQVPVMLGGGSYDPATPVVFEQVLSFPWLTTPDKYLALVEGQAHVNFAKLDAGITQLVESVPGLTLPSVDLISRYTHAMSVAFFEVYLLGNQDYRPYLEPAYAADLSRGEPFKLLLLDGTATPALEPAIARFRSS
jgi:predicted dienelactone hydrolase